MQNFEQLDAGQADILGEGARRQSTLLDPEIGEVVVVVTAGIRVVQTLLKNGVGSRYLPHDDLVVIKAVGAQTPTGGGSALLRLGPRTLRH